MNLNQLLQERAAEGKPVRVGLIGAGKFGTMFLAQARTTPGMQVVCIADLQLDRSREALERASWSNNQNIVTFMNNLTRNFFNNYVAK